MNAHKFLVYAGSSKITKVAITHETGGHVYIDKRKRRKITCTYCFADSEQEAVRYLVMSAERALLRARYDMMEAEKALVELKRLSDEPRA